MFRKLRGRLNRRGDDFYDRRHRRLRIDCALGPLSFRGERPKTLVHVGANTGQEFELYEKLGVEKAIYVEPLDDAFFALQQRLSRARRPGIHVPVQALCLSEKGRKAVLNVSNKGGLASSVLNLGRVRALHPEVEYLGMQEVYSTTIDAVMNEQFSHLLPELMVVDTQGTELEVLKGAVGCLRSGTRFVFCEVSDEPLYEHGCTEAQIGAFLSQFGFRLVYILLNGKGWGDALYVKDPFRHA